MRDIKELDEDNKILVEFMVKKTKWRIDITPYSYILRSLHIPRDKSKEAVWMVEGYYNDLFYLLLKLFKMGALAQKQHKDITNAIKHTLNTLEKSILKGVGCAQQSDLP